MNPALQVIIVCMAAAALPASAQIYVGASRDGSVVLSNFASVEAPNKLILGDASKESAIGVRRPQVGQSVADMSSIVLKVAQEVDVSPHLLHAVITVESGYDTRAVSRKGAQGLMQLMPATAQRFGVTNPFDPHDNVLGGARYLKVLLAQFKGDLQLTLAAYNAGENAVVRNGNRVPPIAETQKYVPKVIAHMQRAART